MRKISHKIWIGMMLIVLLLSGTLLLFQHFYLEKYYLDSKVERVKSEILDIVSQQSMATDSGVFPKLDALAYQLNISIEIVDSDRNSIYVNEQAEELTGETLQVDWVPDFSVLTASLTAAQGSGNSTSLGSSSAQSGGQGGSGGSGDGTGDGTSGTGTGSGNGNQVGEGVVEEGPERTTLIDQTFDGEDQVETTSHPQYGFEVLVLSILFDSDLGEEYVAMATIPLAPINDMIAITSQFLTYASLLLFLIAGIIAYLISRQLTRPIRKLTKAAAEIEKGQLDTRVATHSKDEIGALCLSFNNMADTLEKTGNLRTEIVENVSHEMRTPLSIIKGYADLLGERESQSPETTKAQLAIISKEADRMDFLLGDILDFAQMQSGMLEIKSEPFDIASCVSSIIASYQSILHESNMKITYQQNAQGDAIGDQRRIQQVLHNLIKNAINYSPDGGSVNVTLEDVDGFAKVGITNAGPVIPQEEIDLIWDRYYRTKGIKKRNIIGSGLGLSIVKSILEAHEARYGVVSQEATGTTFWFELKKNENK
jgi:signal transduction histidine kinase